MQIENLAFVCPKVFTKASFDSLNSSAGTWVFDHRRWLNPTNPRELQQLRQVFQTAHKLCTFAVVRIAHFTAFDCTPQTRRARAGPQSPAGALPWPPPVRRVHLRPRRGPRSGPCSGPGHRPLCRDTGHAIPSAAHLSGSSLERLFSEKSIRVSDIMQAVAIGPYSNLTPPLLFQAAWSQLRPSYDPSAPGTDEADLPRCSARDGEAMTVLLTEKSGSSDPTVGPYDSEKLWAAMRGRQGRGSPAPDRSVMQNHAALRALWHRSPPPAGPSPPAASPRLSASFPCHCAGPELEGCWAVKWAEEALGPAGCGSTEVEAVSDGSGAAHASRTRCGVMVDCCGAAGGSHGWTDGFAADGAVALAVWAGKDCGGERGGCWCFSGRRAPGRFDVGTLTCLASN